MIIQVKEFFDPATFTLTYIVYDEISKDAVIIDPVLDYDPAASKINHHSIKKVEQFVQQHNLYPHYVLDTHAHADHVSGSAEIKKRFPEITTAIGSNILKVQNVFSQVFNINLEKEKTKFFDTLLEDGQTFQAGTLEIKTIFTPGHTPACTSFLIEDKLFTGDTLFMPDSGTGRCDFPAGSAQDLYHSIHEKIYSLPNKTEIYVGHDYQPEGRDLQFKTTVEESKLKNIQLKQETTEEEFIKFRTKRDQTLSAPRLLLPSIQINIRGGHFPEAEENDTSYLKIPLR